MSEDTRKPEPTSPAPGPVPPPVPPPQPEVRDWIFTFGWGQHGGFAKNKFVRIRGTWASAREAMVQRYGRAWAHQYPDEESAGVTEFHLEEVR